MLKLGIDPEKLYRTTFISQYGLCCCNMALVSFRLFCKNLGHLREYFGQMVYRPPGKQFPVRLWEGIGLVCTRRFLFHKFYNFLLFNFLILIFFGIFFLPTTFTHTHNHDPRPTTSTHYPRPTTFSYTRVYIRLCKHGKRFLLLK